MSDKMEVPITPHVSVNNIPDINRSERNVDTDSFASSAVALSSCFKHNCSVQWKLPWHFCTLLPSGYN